MPRKSLLWIAFAAFAFIAPHALAAPSNDFYLGATAISGPSGSTSGSLDGASIENGEPLHAGSELAVKSVWFFWTAPAGVNGVAIFDTAGSTFDTALAVHTGRSLVSAVLVAENDDDIAANLSTSRVAFPITAGKEYRIAVAGDGSAAFTLNWTTLGNGLVRFSREFFVANEESGTATVTVERFGNALGALAVPVIFPVTTDTTATPVDDFDATPLTANFAAGETTATVTIPLVADTAAEGDEEILLALSSPGTGSGLDALATTTVTIRDAQDDPANDKFAGATELTGAGATATADNTTAGLEAGEPVHGGVADGRSVWFKFTPTTSGALALDTAGSVVDGAPDALDTILDVYTGSAVNALTPVASNDDAGDAVTSRVVVPVTANVTYFIAIDSRTDAGLIALQWAFSTGGFVQFGQPEFVVGDAATTATVTVSRLGSTTSGANVAYATADAGSAVAGVNYTAASGSLAFAAGEATKTFSVSLLNNTAIEGDKTFSVTLSGALGGAALGLPSTATVRIEDTPENDTFATATTLAGVTDLFSTTNAGARLETGEPQHGGPGGHSIWFKWRAPANGAVAFDTAESSDDNGDPLDTLIAAYTGSALNALTRIGVNDNAPRSVNGRLAFRVTGGFTYLIAVDGRDGAVGDINLAWTFSPNGLVQFSQPTFQVNENGGSATITLTRTEAAVLGAMSVDVAIEGITATEGADFGSLSTDVVTFAAGQVTSTFTVPITSDAINEADETIELTVSTSDGSAVIGERSLATLTINDLADDPANDFFASLAIASGLSGSTGNTVVVTTGASREPGELLHAGVLGHRSVWFKWTSPVAGRASLDTTGSVGFGGGELDTVLAVYTGSSLATLVPVPGAANDDAQPGVKTSRVSFDAAAGTTYFIAVDSSGEDGGEVSLSHALGGGGLLQFGQPQYVVREDVAGGNVTITVERVGSTTGAVSVNWAAAEVAGGGATAGADFIAQSGTLNLPAGATSASFDVAITNDGAIEGNESFAVTLSAPQGGAVLSNTTVSARVVIDDDNDDPANDLFASAAALTGASGTVSGDLAAANLETGEPATPGGHTIWYRWTAPTNGTVQFDTAGSGAVDTILAAYTGATLATLQPVAVNDDAAPGTVSSRIAFAAIVGTTYRISVDARDPISGPVPLNFQLTTGGSFGFDVAAYRVNEGAGPVQILVTRSGTNANNAAVEYDIVPGVIPGLNYAQTGQLVFGAGQVTRTVSIPIPQVTGEQTFRVRLKNPSFSAVIGQETVEVRILDLSQRPANDSLASATPFTVAPGDTDGSLTLPATNVGATRDAGESLPSPLLRNVGGGRTVWFQWKAPANGTATFDTDGSIETVSGDPLDTVMAVFTGTDPRRLTLIAENDEAPDAAMISAVSFRAVSGRTYSIAVDTVGDVSGEIALNWSLEAPEDGPLLAPVAGFTPTITFRDTYAEGLKPFEGDFETVPNQRIEATFVLSLAEVDIAGLTAETPVNVSVGDFSFEGVLGDDPAYRARDKNATFSVTVDADNNAGFRKVGTVKFTWTDTRLTIRIAVTSAAEHAIYATNYTEGTEVTEASAGFAGVTGVRPIYVTGTTGTRTVTKSTGDFDLLSADVRGTADYTLPTVTVTQPAASEVPTATPAIDLEGSAADNFSIAGVTVSVNGGEPLDTVFTPAVDAKTASWRLDAVPLVDGVNTFTVFAFDESGNVARLVKTVTRPRQAPISLLTDGQGTIATSFAGSLLNLGATYTVTATPATGWVFRGWTGNDGSTSSAPAFTFTMSEGLRLTARFIANPFQNLNGSFSGFARSSNALPADTGVFSVDVTPTGALSGTFYLGSKKITLAGVFDDNGNFTATLPPRRPGGPSIVVTLRLDLVGGSEQITGTITDGTFVSGVTSDREVISTANPTPLAGFKYTVVLANATGLRGNANGFLTAVVAADGSVRFAGRLADNATISTSGFLPKSGVVQLYDGLSGRAAVAGALAFSPAATAKIDGGIAWYRPDAGVVDLTARGERWDKAVAPLGTVPNGATTAEVGGLPTLPVTVQSITIRTGQALVTVAVPGLRTISVDANAGTFAAAGKLSNGRAFTARGALLQQSGAGAAFINVSDSVGYLIIGTP